MCILRVNIIFMIGFLMVIYATAEEQPINGGVNNVNQIVEGVEANLPNPVPRNNINRIVEGVEANRPNPEPQNNPNQPDNNPPAPPHRAHEQNQLRENLIPNQQFPLPNVNHGYDQPRANLFFNQQGLPPNINYLNDPNHPGNPFLYVPLALFNCPENLPQPCAQGNVPGNQFPQPMMCACHNRQFNRRGMQGRGMQPRLNYGIPDWIYDNINPGMRRMDRNVDHRDDQAELQFNIVFNLNQNFY